MTLNNSQLFHGKYVRLAPFYPNDTVIIAKWHEDAEYLRMVDTDIAVLKSIESFNDFSRSQEGSNTNICFGLRSLTDDKLIGFVALLGIEWNNRACILAIGIGDRNNQNKGYGSDALQLILKYAFHELNLFRVGLDVTEYNKQAMRAYEKVGFKVEGSMRAAVLRDGNKYDRIIMGILYDEWLNMNN
ncbi:GNAT family N-acetyltransferase [Caldalkalibacillus mannanilyticus]|uniref:GNAT family N-acetyltransferase n=1 Tax=Caldalkalibacillus mannanilyticus TaxID=1418 RepID=UPI0004691870|nr:GNAT family protein [Caldalkalibacillus mannanilyticus]